MQIAAGQPPPERAQWMLRASSGEEIIVVRVGQALRGYRNRCPHVGIGLDWGDGDCLDPERGELVCSMHGARFRPADGWCVAGPCAGKHLQAVELRRVGAGVDC